MSDHTDPTTESTPHDAEDAAAAQLENDRSALVELRELVVRRELELTQLQHDILRFQHDYMREVGERQIQLDEIRAQVARRIADMRPDDDTLAAAADDAEQRTQNARPAPKPRPADGQNKLLPGQHKILRRLFREVARRVHPDLATDPESIELRNRLMHEAREAYQRGDVETLAQMYETYSDGDSTGKPTTDHAYVRRALEQMRLRLVAVEETIDELKDGFLYHLMQRTHDAALDDRDLLTEMAAHLDAQIDAAKREFDALNESDSES